MAESIALPILMEVAKPMFKIVATRVTEEIHFFVGFKKELKDLQDNIDTIASFVDRLTPVPDAAVQRWLTKTIRIIHKTEDMLDVLAYEKHRSDVMKKRRPQNKAFSGKIRLVFLPLRRVYLRSKMACWIRRINSDIEAVLNKAQVISSLKGISAPLQPAARNTADGDQLLQQVRRNVDTSIFVGRGADVASVVDMLVCNPAQDSDDNISTTNRLSVVAIVGIGGLGKSSLAKQVCENERVIVHYSERIWISELKDFNTERILNKIAEVLEKGNYEDASSEAAIRKLKGHLGGKRYLLVLDDVWNTNQDVWGSMRSALETIGSSKDSMILTTTRDDAVAKTMHASVHPLLGLSEGASWLLFKQIAFANWSNGAVALEATGMKIVKKCKGVPLAIRSIAGTLNKKRNPREWSTIEESELWDIRHNETGVLPSLKLSYDHLCLMLRKCFSLCAFWPKDTLFYKYELIYRWMALGLLQDSKNGNITMEDIGEEYVNELSSISFLLIEERNELGEGTIYKMHDLVYDLARSVAMHERLYLEAIKNENNAVNIQHVTIIKQAEITLDFPNKRVLENIRSLEMLYNIPKGLLVHVKYLRVLSLEDSTIEVVPESIGKLKCLKYLDLENNPIKVLPNSINKLYNLQSLSLCNCKPLFKIPRGVSNLVNLRHLGLSFHFCPEETGMIGQLIQLQTLPPLQLSEGGFQITELGGLHHVKGSLDIKGLEHIKSKLDAEESRLSRKSRIEQLRLTWDSDDNNIKHEEVLDGLRPNRNLKLLSLQGYGGEKFPSWLMRMNNVSEDRHKGYAGTLCNLIKIELIDCGRCQQLPTMGHLPLLKLLEIRNMQKLKQIGPELYGDADLLMGNSNEASSSGSSPRVKSMVYFESLKELRLIGLENLGEWCEPAAGPGKRDGFPSLEVLVIEKCLWLKEAPNKFPSLKELIVKSMSSSKPLMKILRNKGSVSNLTKLEIVEVEELTHIPEEVGECTSLQELIIYWCPKLESIPNLSGLGSLREFKLFRNDGLTVAAKGLDSCKSLEKLWISCCGKMETLPDLSGLSRLWNLSIRGMRKMIRQPPDWVFNLPSLRTLHIGDYDYEDEGVNEEFPDMRCLLKITSLECLYVLGWEELQNIPEQLQHFTALKTLAIYDFEKVEQLPDWLGNLSSLQNLFPTRCKSLKKLPSKEAMDQLTNFSYLEIEDCPLLEQAVDKNNGPEYHKIAKPHIQVKIFNSTS